MLPWLLATSGCSGGGGGSTAAPASISSVAVSPASASVPTQGQQAFSATVAGTGAFSTSVTWSTTGGSISGAGLFTAPAAPGTFTVRATSQQDASKSGSAMVVVTPAPVPPAFTQQPAAATVTAPGSATFSAAASGLPTPTLQWQSSGDGGATWASLAGATGASFTTGPTALQDSGTRYRAIATSSAGSATSAEALLTVQTLPAFTLNPLSQVLREGASAAFSAEATGSPAPTLAWERSTDGASWTPIGGAAGTLFGFPVSKADHGTLVRAVASNAAGSTPSTPAWLLVWGDADRPVVLALGPDPGYLVVGARYEFTVQASGLAPLHYTWLKDGVVVGEAAPRHVIASATLADLGEYAVQVSNAYGTGAGSLALRLKPVEKATPEDGRGELLAALRTGDQARILACFAESVQRRFRPALAGMDQARLGAMADALAAATAVETTEGRAVYKLLFQGQEETVTFYKVSGTWLVAF